MSSAKSWDYEKLKRLVSGERLPLVVVDLDVLADNARRLASVAENAGKSLRIATKSVRVPELISKILDYGETAAKGLMCYSVPEADMLANRGFDDLLVAYPTAQEGDLELLYDMRRRGVDVTLMIDCPAHIERLEALSAHHEASSEGTKIQVCIDVDLSWHPLGPRGPHLGVQRSPIRDIVAFRALLDETLASDSLQLVGVMGYEAQIAGMGEKNPFTPMLNPIKRLLKSRSVPDVARRREAIHRAIADRDLRDVFFNGGGTGSILTTSREPFVTEVTAGSGFLQSHLFDYYEGNENEPALCFALQVTRAPQPGIVTCQAGGFIASGEIGSDKAPVSFLPSGLVPLGAEGFGEVQTPLRVPDGLRLEPGDPVFFRPAKAGEIAERFDEYLLKSGDELVGPVKTYRGLGYCFH